ncbi:MAG: hypothetical protein ACP5UA_10760 [Candidatus Hydrogenedens sp.]
MTFLNIFINICLFAVSAGDVGVELYNPRIPWFRSSEYVIRNYEVDNKNCPEWKNLYEEIEITEKPIIGAEHEGCVKKVIIDPIKSGKYLIPSSVVKNKEGKEWETSSFVLDVREPTDKEKEEIQNIAGIIEPQIGNTYKNLIVNSLLVISLLIAVACSIYLWKRYYIKGKSIEEKVELPWEKAFRRLRDLKAKDLPSQSLYEPYYVQLTWILRYYIEDRFNIHAPEQTTQEFIETTMKEKVLTSEQQKLLYSFLSHCDKVKFAQFVPTIEQMEAGYNLVWNFIEDTKLKEQPKEEGNQQNRVLQ